MFDKSYSFVRFALVAAVIVGIPALASAQYSYTEDFSSGTRPSNIISGGGLGTPTVTGLTVGTNPADGFTTSALTVKPTGNNAMLIDNLPGGSISLGSTIGDTLTLSLDISFANPTAGSSLRLGLFNYNGVTPPTKDNPGTTVTNGVYGYNVQIGLTSGGSLTTNKEMGATPDAEGRGTGTSSKLVTDAGTFGGGPDSVQYGAATYASAGFTTLATNTAYSLTTTLTRVSGGVQLTTVLTDGTQTITTTGIDNGTSSGTSNGKSSGASPNFFNNSDPWSTFNFFGINTGSQSSTFTIDNLSVSNVTALTAAAAPEPGALALLAAALPTLGLLRRRR